MTKGKKTLIFFCVLALTAGILWFYWEWPMAMDTLLPQEAWVRLELRYGTVEDPDIEFADPDMEKILSQMAAVRLTRAEKRPYLDDQYFRITLSKGESYPTMIYVGSTGRVEIARELDFDHWEYYEGGEGLYRYLFSLSQGLTALYPVA